MRSHSEILQEQQTTSQILIQGCTLLDPQEPGHLRHNQDILIRGQKISGDGSQWHAYPESAADRADH